MNNKNENHTPIEEKTFTALCIAGFILIIITAITWMIGI